MAGYIGSKSSVTQVDGYTEAEADAEFVNDPNGAITVSGSNVGIGTSSPSAPLHVQASTSAEFSLWGGAGSYGRSKFNLQSVDDGTSTGKFQITTESSVPSNPELLTITNSGNVGIGDSNPLSILHVGTGASANVPITFAPSTGGNIEFRNTSSTGTFTITNGNGSSENLRIDSSGNLLVGKTASSYNTVGCELLGNGAYEGLGQFTTDGIHALTLNRQSSDGAIAVFRKDGTTVGSMGTLSGVTYYAHSNGDGLALSNGYIFPSSYGGAKDNQIDIGISWARFDNIWATNGTIQTSDFNEKQDIASLTATEMLVGKRISALFKTFRWKDAVVEKGDNARTHTGVIAQDVQAAFTAEGLDAGDYAMFMSDTWWEHDVEVPAVEAVAEVLDEDGNVTTEAVEAVDAYTRTDNYDTEAEAPEGATSKTRLGIRYPELLSFVAAYNEQRFASIEARLTALEA